MRKLFGKANKVEVNVNKIDRVIENLRDAEDTTNPFAIAKEDGYEIIEARYIRDSEGNWVVTDVIEVKTSK